MSEDEKNILNAMKQVRNLFKEFALILETIDDQLEGKGFETITGSTCLADGSSSLYSPTYWMPTHVLRFYQNAHYSNLQLYVAIYFDDDNRQDYLLNQPIISAGVFDFQTKKVTFNGSYDRAKFFFEACAFLKKTQFIPGEILTLSIDMDWKKEVGDYAFDSATCFAYPLLSIKNSSDIEEKITKVLLKIIEEK